MGQGEQMTANSEKHMLITDTQDNLYDYITKKLDVKNNTSVRRVQRDLNVLGKLVYGDDFNGLSEDGMYGKKTIRRINGFKDRYLDDVNNVIKVMKDTFGDDYMENPENHPKLPGYKDPKKMRR